MPVKCEICGNEFKSQITNTHLKKHNMTIVEYKEKYGEKSITSPEYREQRAKGLSGQNNPNYGNNWTEEQKRKLSEKLKGKTAWNKGMSMDDYSEEYRESIKLGIQRREEKYKNGEFDRPTYERTDVIRKKISKSVKVYAKNNKEMLKERAKKAVCTRRKNGNMHSSMKGKRHSDKTKQLISKKSKEFHENRRKEINKKIIKLASENNLIVDSFDSGVVNLICDKCKTYFSYTRQYFTESKFKHEMCPTCYPRTYKVSKAESEIAEFIESIYDGKILYNNRTALNTYEIDIYLPDINVGIEYNGLYWHSELVLLSNNLDPKRDYKKWKLAQENDIKLIQIFEDEWITKSEIVKSRLRNIIGLTKNVVYARNCEIVELSPPECKEFLTKTHLQGSGKSSVKLGLVHNGNIVSAMTFSKGEISRRSNMIEMSRFSNGLDLLVVGGASKLFRYYVNNYNPSNVVSYSDNRWGSGLVYEKLGFEKYNDGVPGYWYFKPNEFKRHHRYTLRKTKVDDPNLSEFENRIKNGWNRIWDCGHSKWIWKQ